MRCCGHLTRSLPNSNRVHVVLTGVPTIFIQTVTVKLSNGVTGKFVGPAIVDETTPKEVEVVDVAFSPPRQSPYEVRIVEQPAEPARPGPKGTAPP